MKYARKTFTTTGSSEGVKTKCPWVQIHESSDPMAGIFSAHYDHLVFSTKARANLITAEIEPRLYEFIGGII